jgi:hypothetical protein
MALWSAPFFVAAGAAVLRSTIGDVEAALFQQDLSVLNRQDYGSASRIFIPLAEQFYPGLHV